MISPRRDLYVKALIPPSIVQCGSPPSLTDLLATDDVTESTACHPATNVTADVVPPPKRKKQMMTALALQKKQVEDLKQMKHKSVAHKKAVHLYLKEKEKPGGMSLRQVQDHIAKKNSVTVHYSTISRYANEGLLNASPKKMGPAGTFAKSTYKLLCDALSSFIPINQMTARAGDNSRIKLIDMLVKTLSISSTKASTLLTRLLRDTAEDTMSADKLNCAKDRRICWTTFQNLDL